MANVFGAAAGVTAARNALVDASLTGSVQDLAAAAGAMDNARVYKTVVDNTYGLAGN